MNQFYVESTIGKSALNLTGPQNVKKDILYVIIERKNIKINKLINYFTIFNFMYEF